MESSQFYRPSEDILRVACSLDEYEMMHLRQRRIIYLFREIAPADYEDSKDYEFTSVVGRAVLDIMRFNREDVGIPPAERKPITIYINSPGGDVTEGFPLIAAIELSKTPVRTVNVGQWSSMSFLIGITGHKRLALPYTTFLLHDGSTANWGTTSKAIDKAKFDDRFEQEVVKKHVLKHSKMTSAEYDGLVRVEYYMLPDDAMRHGFIDEIVDNLDDIV